MLSNSYALLLIPSLPLLRGPCGGFRAAIEKLRAQNEEFKHDLLLENKFSVRPGDPYAQALINRLQDEGDMLARKVSICFFSTPLVHQA